MSPSNHKSEPEIIPPGQSHGYKDTSHNTGHNSGHKTGTRSPHSDGLNFDDLSAQASSIMNHPMTLPRSAYVLFALSVVSGFPLLVGLIVAYLARGEAPVWLKSHYTFLINTFWYFIALFCVGIVLAFFLVGFMLLWLLPLWVAIRVIRGWLLLEDKKPVPAPDSWLFG